VEAIPIFLNLQKVLDGVIFDILIKLIVQNLIEFGGMIETDVANKLVCFEIDRMAIF